MDFLMDFGLSLVYFEPKLLTKIQSKINHFLLRKTSTIYAKMTSFREAKGGPTNQIFALWTHVGGTLAPQGTPGCPRKAQTPSGDPKKSKNEVQNH